MPTSDELEAWRQQPMYDGEPFSQDRQFEVATAAFLGDATYELHTYASVYMENWGLDLQLEMPTPEKLARWVHDEQCPHAELVISEERLQRLFQGQARWFTLADDTGTAMAVLLGPTEDFSLGRFIDVFRLWREATEEFRTAWRHHSGPSGHGTTRRPPSGQAVLGGRPRGARSGRPAGHAGIPIGPPGASAAPGTVRPGPRSLAGKPLAGFYATPIRRIPGLCGTVAHVLR